MVRIQCLSLFLLTTLAALQTATAGAPCSDGEECPSPSQAKDNALLQMGSLKTVDAKRTKEPMHEGSTMCAGVAWGDRFIQLGQFRLGAYDDNHLSLSHQGGKTAQIFRSDGTLHAGPRADFGTWTRPAGASSGVSYGDRFIQLGKFRLGAYDDNHLSISHEGGKTAQIFRSDGTLHSGPRSDFSTWPLSINPLCKDWFYEQVGVGYCDLHYKSGGSGLSATACANLCKAESNCQVFTVSSGITGCRYSACGSDGGTTACPADKQCPINTHHDPASLTYKMAPHKKPLGTAFGRWDLVDSAMAGVGSVAMKEGITATDGSTLSTGQSGSVMNGLQATIGFEAGPDFSKLTGSVTAYSEMTVTRSVRDDYTTSRAKTTAITKTRTCAAIATRNGQKWFMWQWVFDVPFHSTGDHSSMTARVRGSRWMCLFCVDISKCKGDLTPQCPPGFCLGQQCQQCKAGWQVQRS